VGASQDTTVVGTEGHVADYEGVGCPTAHGLGVIYALVKGHWHSSGLTVNRHAEGVAHKQHVHPSLLRQLGGGEVVGRHPHGYFALFFHLL
jgi:hypothetical protein